MKSPLKNTEPIKKKKVRTTKDWRLKVCGRNEILNTHKVVKNKSVDDLFINYNYNSGSPYEVVYGREGYPKRKRFKTRTKALAYAKSYMGTH